MICRSCGAEIADKAIVCYRCGAPTAAPAPPAARKTKRPSNWVGLPVILLIVVLAVLLIPETEPGSTERIAAWAATWLVTLGVVAWLRRRRRR